MIDFTQRDADRNSMFASITNKRGAVVDDEHELK